MDRISPTMRPLDRPAGFQRWRHLLFLHWEVPASALAAVLPRELTVDTFEGRAYVGVVPFTMRDVSPWWSPSVPGVSNFDEMNVRTYVHYQGRDPGVWFFSLDAAATIAVLVARAGWSLPYYRASMKLDVSGARVTYRSKRRWPEPTPAELECRYVIGEEIGAAEPGTFEHFLAERYILYAKSKSALLLGRVHHRPYPLHRAEVSDLRESMVRAAGLPDPAGAPHVLYSPGVDVDVFALKPVA
jgi:uncharacterized protein YqjF (DUF2071 family)